MDLGQLAAKDLLSLAAIAIAIGLIVWYLIGAQLGRQQATRLAHLSVDLLRPLGSEGSFRWLASTCCELNLTNLRRPFRSIRVVIWLEPRELLPVWALNRLRGRRDLFAIAADLTKPPDVSFELVQPNSLVGGRALRKATARGWPAAPQTFAGEALTLAAPRLDVAREAVGRCERGLPVRPASVLRLAASDTSPQLSLSLGTPAQLSDEGTKFANWLRTVANAVGE